MGVIARLAFAAASLAAFAAAPAHAQVEVAAGQAVTVTLGQSDPRIAATDKTEPTAVDRKIVADINAGNSGISADAAAEAGALPIAPGVLKVRLLSVDGKSTLLALENGYDKGLVYRATILRGDNAQPTDVCLVMPMRRGYEYWPYPIDKITLSAFTLRPWVPADGIPCA